MTRKDYVAIAEAIAVTRFPLEDVEKLSTHATSWNDAVLVTARNIADVLQSDNPRFDRARFLKACGVA